jgi:hypothetical protein
LWELGELKNNELDTVKAINLQMPNSELNKGQFIYPPRFFDKFKRIAIKNNIFVLSSSLEGIMQARLGGKYKPDQALKKIMELIQTNSIPPEFHQIIKYVRKRIKETNNVKASRI